MTELTDQDRTILDLVATPREEGAMLSAIRDAGMTTMAFYARLRRLLETEAALAHDPITVNRLRAAVTSTIRRHRPYFHHRPDPSE